MPRGIFITLEGGDGSGKSTQGAALGKMLKDRGHKVRLTQEPDGTELGRKVWVAFQQPESTISPLAELLFFQAARAQHVEEVIRPALESGETVLCDRFTDSSIAYQAYGRGLDLELVHALNDIATAGLTPDLTLLFDVSPEIGLARADSGSAREKDVIGQESRAFHQRVRDGYLQLAKREPRRIIVLNGTLPEKDITALAWKHLDALSNRIVR